MIKGFYGGGTMGFPFLGGAGGGLYFDSHGNVYPQVYYGTPGLSLSTGYSPDIEGFLTGTSVSASSGTRTVKHNFGTSGGSTGAGVGFGLPGVGATYGFGPYKLRDIGDSFRPQADEFGYPFPGDGTTAAPLSGENSEYRGASDMDADPPEASNGRPERYLARRADRRRPGPATNTGSPAAPQRSEGPFSLNDAYLEYLRRSAVNPSRSSPTDVSAPVATLAPSNNANFSGGLLGRMAALMGIAPQNPNQLAPPPRDDELRAFYRDDAVQPWARQSWR